MLVLTRRENDRVLFPTLGITVEVMKLSKSRASLGIKAPKGVRVIRHELLESDGAERTENLIDSVKREAVKEMGAAIEQQVDEASRRLLDAQELLKVGDSEAAFECIAVALAELDALSDDDGDSQSSAKKPWAVAGGVAESSSGYTVENPKAPSLTVRYPDDGFDHESELIGYLRRQGYQVRAG